MVVDDASLRLDATGWLRSGSSRGSPNDITAGARISGVGPLKSLPVMRDRVCMSKAEHKCEVGLPVGKRTIWLAIFQTVIDPLRIFLVFTFELVLTGLAVPTR